MPKRVNRRAKKGGKKGARGRPASAPRSMNPMNDMATVTEVVEQADLLPNTVYNTAFRIDAITQDETAVSQRFMRALTVASQYKFYRCSRVEYEYIPSYNTFQDGSGTTVPYLYHVMNRTGEELPAPPYDNAFLQRMGAMPIKLTKQITKSYKPNTLMGTCSTHDLVAGTNPTGNPGGNIRWTFTPKYDEWQSTEFLGLTPQQASAGGNTMTQVGFAPSTYYGHYAYIKQDRDATGEDPVCDLIVKVCWEFKDPRSLNDTREAQMANIAQLFPTQQ
nr:MAG: capsid protein [Cressdnaviricota sp.]